MHALEGAPDGVFLGVQAALAGRYSLMRELGRGGMAIVYLAHEVRLDRPVALKVLPAYLATPSLRERFMQEARTAAKLSHPNIVPIYAVDEARDFVYFAMSYVEGETLATRIARHGTLSALEVSRIMRDVAQALAYAHRQGVVHRDIKPDNILIERGSNRPIVADFGIAHVASASPTTAAGQLIGTPDYMSPEQASGEVVDARTDIYSLGLVGYCALAGRLPFSGDSLGTILAQRISTPAPKLRAVALTTPPKLAEAIDRCLSTAREDRYQTGEAVADAIDAAVDKPRTLPVALEQWVRGVEALPFVQVLVTIFIVQLFYDEIDQLIGSFPPPIGPGDSEWRLHEWPWITLFVFVPLLVYGIQRYRALREVVSFGFGIGDLRAALASEIAVLREMRVAPGAGWMTRLRGALPGLIVAGIGLIAFGQCAGSFSEGEGFWIWLIWLVFVGMAIAVRTSRSTQRPVRLVDLEIRAWMWESWLGPLAVLIARVGLKRRSAPAATHRPTEIALGGAALALFEALPKELRRDLTQVPSIVQRLEARAQAIRQELDALQRHGAGVDSRRPATRTSERRDAADVAIQHQRERGHRNLTDAITALENMRMGLLRLHAGAIQASAISVEIAAAEEVCRALDAAVIGQTEVARLLR